MKITLKNVRLSFPDLFEPRPFKPGDVPKYKATLLVPKGSDQAKAVDAAIAAVAKEKWPKTWEKVLASIKGNANKFCWQDGDTKTYDGYEGMMAFSAGNKARPTIIDRNKDPLTKDDGKPYAGCYVNATIRLWAQDNQYGKRINAQLRAVQYVKDGAAFGEGSVDVNKEFAPLPDDEEGAI